MKGRGEEGVLNKVLNVGSLTLRANSFCIPSTDKWCPFHTPSLELKILLNCCKCTVLKIWTSNNCKLGECVRWGGEGGGWWVNSNTDKDSCWYSTYWQKCLIWFLDITSPSGFAPPSHYHSLPTLQFITISFFLINARVYCTFYIYLAKPLSKVHVSNNRSNTDYDPQDILLHYRMINKIG